MKSNDYILWSGGYDSTLCLLNTIEKYINMNNDVYDNSELIVVSLDMKLISENKMIRERNVREKIKEYINAKYENIHIDFYEINVSPDDLLIRNGISLGYGLHQVPMMLGTMFPVMRCNSSLYLSYISTDDSGTELGMKLINDAWNSLLLIVNKGKCDIKFPLIEMNKCDVLYKLYCYDPMLLSMCTCCENMDGHDQCGECTPCNTLRKAVLSIINDTDNKYHNEKSFVECLGKRFDYLL